MNTPVRKVRKTRSNKGQKRAPYKMSGKPRKTRSNKGQKRGPYKMSRKTRANKSVSKKVASVPTRRTKRATRKPQRYGFM